MKQCPECRRLYSDESLNFCLVDGEWLVEESSDDSPTAVLVPPVPDAEALTRQYADRDNSRPVEPNTDDASGAQTGISYPNRRWLLFAFVAAAVLIPAILLSYRYLPRAAADQTINSIAVLPFENTSGDANAEYISDGITESLINSLSQLPNVKVISRASVFRYKGDETDLAKIANDLGVLSIMTGRVVERDGKLDINVNLTDTSNGTNLWGQRFIRDASDIFVIQDEIARQVTDSLRVRLSGTQQDKITKRYTTDPEAYRLYLQGRYLFNNFSEENLTKAIQYFDQAVAADPNYALAYAARSDCYMQLGDLSISMAEAMSKARHDSTAALAIDPDQVEARTVQAEIKFQFDWDFLESEKDFKAAIASNPNYAESHHQYAWYLAMIGKEDESVAEMKIAQQLDPVNPAISLDTCLPDSFARRWERCRDQSRATLEMFPNFYTAHMTLGTSLSNLGEQSAGIEELMKAVAIEHTPHLVGTLGYYCAKAGRKDDARKALAELEDMSKHRFVASYWMAAVHVGLGENDEAFTWLEKAYQERSWWLVFLKMDPMMESLHSDPRYADLIRRIGYPA